MDSWQLLLKEEVRPLSFSYSSEIVGPLIPGKTREQTTVDIPIDRWFSDYKNQKVQTNLTVQFINDFPITFKSGMVVVRMKWIL